ncbi:hypothetical protein OH76DRAFT_735895 [Lentinus brumalis]|uniref:Uncharacterized protein n=1 Tax=Lentinus brumalis TaxID=2498619 RepID=A0A371DSB3_9APHY|nr:hypothetical protein OH76DRAFT_735895 [Polyporus brumalis]
MPRPRPRTGVRSVDQDSGQYLSGLTWTTAYTGPRRRPARKRVARRPSSSLNPEPCASSPFEAIGSTLYELTCREARETRLRWRTDVLDGTSPSHPSTSHRYRQLPTSTSDRRDPRSYILRSHPRFSTSSSAQRCHRTKGRSVRRAARRRRRTSDRPRIVSAAGTYIRRGSCKGPRSSGLTSHSSAPFPPGAKLETLRRERRVMLVAIAGIGGVQWGFRWDGFGWRAAASRDERCGFHEIRILVRASSTYCQGFGRVLVWGTEHCMRTPVGSRGRTFRFWIPACRSDPNVRASAVLCSLLVDVMISSRSD